MFLANDLSLMPSLNCCPIPAPGLTREIAIFCRTGEFEDIVPSLANDVRRLLDASIYQHLSERWPWISVESAESAESAVTE
ncbi:Uncharacterised protein [Leminorella richardii]|uniref:Uncharacterized protein n=1 Tax=Leminorella richardii TaxID=158841 RepID=A0A2X4XXW6_9GAMM|nr:hypothetical protein [Leminorella richardii]SQI41424.1 Uncharacterised protein [Leminorella richardii]